MENMRFKVGDRVRIKDIDWYNKNKSKSHGTVACGGKYFDYDMKEWCGKTMTILEAYQTCYIMREDGAKDLWTDEMIEGLAEEENNRLTETVVDTVKESNDRYRIVTDPRFDIEVDEGEYYAVRRKKEYPKTFEECVHVLEGENRMSLEQMNTFRKLIDARNAYWKIAGGEMGLGKPWEPDWKNHDIKYILFNQEGEIDSVNVSGPRNYILAFPTEEMRDAFKKNFDPDIESCKELL